MPTFLISVVTLHMVKPVNLVLNLPVIPVFAWYQSYVQSVSQLISSQLSLSSLCILFLLKYKVYYYLQTAVPKEHKVTIDDPVQGCDSELYFWKHGSFRCPYENSRILELRSVIKVTVKLASERGTHKTLWQKKENRARTGCSEVGK